MFRCVMILNYIILFLDELSLLQRFSTELIRCAQQANASFLHLNLHRWSIL